MNTKNPEFPMPDDLREDDALDAIDALEAVEVSNAGDGLVEPANVAFDEEVERVVQPEPVGD